VPVIVWTGKDLGAREHALLREGVHMVVPKGRGARAVVDELAQFVRQPGAKEVER